MKVKTSITIIVALCMTFIITPKAHAGFKGKVVDSDTGEPVEGVVVMLIWYRDHAFSGAEYFKSRETLTDKSGMFYLKGRNKINFNPLTRVGEPFLLIYKGGYESFRNPWVESIFRNDPFYQKFVSFEGDIAVFKLKNVTDLTRNERIKYSRVDVSSEIPYEQKRLLVEELNKERINLGLEPVTY